MMPNEVQKKIAIAAAGINRFYDEGYMKWSEDKFRILFAGAALEETSIQHALALWEQSGAIKIRRDAECFIEVLHPIY